MKRKMICKLFLGLKIKLKKKLKEKSIKERERRTKGKKSEYREKFEKTSDQKGEKKV